MLTFIYCFVCEGPLAALVDKSIATLVMEPRVRTWLGHVRQLPLTEEKSESPHARMAKVKSGAPASRKAWHASTCRLQESLKLYDTWGPELKNKFAKEWPVCKRVAQVDPAKAHINLQMTVGAVGEHIYAQPEGYTGRLVEAPNGD